MTNTMIPVMETKCRELKELMNEIDTLTALAESIKDEIKAAMGDDTVLIAGPFKVTYKPQIANRFDSKSFKAQYPTVYENFCKPTPSRPFRIS